MKKNPVSSRMHMQHMTEYDVTNISGTPPRKTYDPHRLIACDLAKSFDDLFYPRLKWTVEYNWKCTPYPKYAFPIDIL